MVFVILILKHIFEEYKSKCEEIVKKNFPCEVEICIIKIVGEGNR